MTSNQIAYANYRENQRHNLQGEELTRQANTELARHNRMSEDIGYYDATTSRINANTNAVNARTNAFNAQTNYYKAQTEAAKFEEMKRHNEVSEMISSGAFSFNILGQSYSGNYYPLVSAGKSHRTGVTHRRPSGGRTW